jgi:hypothetical protein
LTTPNEIVSISRSTSGPANDAAGAAAIFAVLGTATDGDVDTPVLARSDGDPSEIFEGGPLVEFSEIISSYSRQATIPVRVATATPGAYGALNDDEFDGTAVAAVDATVIPRIDAEIYVVFDVGGDLGDATDGIVYRLSNDGGRTFGARTGLGSSTSITDSYVNAKITLSVPVAALVSLVNDLRTKTLAHYAMGSGTHNSADASSGSGIGAAATNEATAIALLNQIRAADLLHAANATAHNSADSVSFAGLPAVATNGPTAVALGNAIRTGHGVHIANATVHDGADGTNTISASAATSGTILAGDILQVETAAPQLDAAGLATAFSELNAFNGSIFGGVVIPGTFDPATMWTPLINGLDALRASQIPVGVAIVEARPPAEDETPTEYRVALEAEWSAYKDERVYVAYGRGRYDPATLDRCESQFYRSHAAPLAARLAALDYGESPGVTKPSERDRTRPSRFGGPLAGFRIYDDSGNLVGHDERVNPGAAAAGFGVVTSYRRAPSPTDAYVFQPKNKAPNGNRAPHVAHQRTIAVVEGVIYQVGTEEIESRLLYEPGRSTIRGDVADALEAQIRNRVLAEVGDPTISTSARVSRLLVEVDRNAAIDPDDPIVPLSVEVDTAFYVSAFSVNLQVNRSAS